MQCIQKRLDVVIQSGQSELSGLFSQFSLEIPQKHPKLFGVWLRIGAVIEVQVADEGLEIRTHPAVLELSTERRDAPPIALQEIFHNSLWQQPIEHRL